MTQRETSLVLLMDALGVEGKVDKFADRKAFQKIVYLAACAGIDLGYRYGWYVYGPYAPDLARDYFSLDRTAQEEIGAVKTRYRLDPRHAGGVERLKAALASPQPEGLDRHSDWMELLASYAFLSRQQRSHDDIVTRLGETKPHVAGYAAEARAILEATGLIACPSHCE